MRNPCDPKVIYEQLAEVAVQFAIDCFEKVAHIGGNTVHDALEAVVSYHQEGDKKNLDILRIVHKDAARLAEGMGGGVAAAWVGTRGQGRTWTDARARWKACEAAANCTAAVLGGKEDVWAYAMKTAEAAAEAVSATTPEPDAQISRTSGWYSTREWQYNRLLKLLKEGGFSPEHIGNKLKRSAPDPFQELMVSDYYYRKLLGDN